ncbi:MAG: hypothetical protein R3C05_20000 [Pirellulaceae bacterium]
MSSATFEVLFPAGLRQVFRMRAVAKFRRLRQRIFAPRRALLSAVAIILGLFWFGQAAAGILLRPPADPQRLRLWITGGLVLYAYWHLLRSAWAKELTAVMWSRSEQGMLHTAPLSPSQLMTYRLAGIVGPALLKASLLTVVLWPDAARLELTFIGLVIALGVLELARMIVEIGCSGLSLSHRRVLKFATAIVAVGLGASLGRFAWAHWDSQHPVPGIQLPSLLLSGLTELSQGSVTRALGLPLQFVADIATSATWNLFVLRNLAIGVIELGTLVLVIYQLDRWMTRSHIERERKGYDRQLASSSSPARQAILDADRFESRRLLPRLPDLGGTGVLVARQAVTALRYWPTILITLLIPGAFSLFPVFVLPEHSSILVHVTGSLIFYTLLLGPPALKIDFRRDLDRMLMLRQLPLSPMRVVAGQLAIPVAACITYQIAVLVVTAVLRPTSPASMLVAVGVMVPATLFIFALENLIFRAFPQRIGQEGIEVLIRTTLVFTFKGLLFVAAAALLLGWSLLVRHCVTESLQPLIFRGIGLTRCGWRRGGDARDISRLQSL